MMTRTEIAYKWMNENKNVYNGQYKKETNTKTKKKNLFNRDTSLVTEWFNPKVSIMDME